MKPLEAIRCTLPNCSCECFSPGKTQIRSCETCKHGWVAHALDKLGYRHIFSMGMQVEVVQPNIVFDIASLMLYGSQATPIRLKILLDRLFSVLQHDEVLQVLQGFGWTYEDYARGYILQDSAGNVLDKWTVATREEEHVILQQFLRFGETKSIAQEIILQDTRDHQDMFLKQSPRSDSEIKKFIERSNNSMHSYIRGLDTRHLFSGRLPFVPVSSRLMRPQSFSPPSSRELRPPAVTVSSASPVTSSPLGRLQTMQPFDYRREQCSPTISPSIPEKHPPGSSPSESPKRLSSTPTSSTSMTPPFTPIKSRESREHTPLPMNNSLPTPMTLPIRPPSRGQVEDAIDYSTGNKEKKEFQPSMLYDERKLKHLRKSNTPNKRSWTPSPGFGCAFIGPNGKKRVLCTACNKTFCDKGALKIHYSAVHLKEMHKCTVEGCNMMFSSRRSRNRHSANPNPKLHMPQKRLKLPDGATCIDEGMQSKGSSLGGSPPSMVLPPSLGQKALDLDSPDSLSHGGHAFYAELNAHLAMFPSPEKKMKLERDIDETPRDLRLSDKKDKVNESETDDQDLGSDEDNSKVDSPQQRNRRKANKPTRCTTQSEESFMLSDDNSEEQNSEKGSSKENCVMAEYVGQDSKGSMDQGDNGNPVSDSDDDDEGMVMADIDDDDEDDEDDESDNKDDGRRKQEYLFCRNGREESKANSKPGDFSSMAAFLGKTSSPMDFSMKGEQRARNQVDEDPGFEPASPAGTMNANSDDPTINQCSICHKSCVDAAALQHHYVNVHQKSAHVCTINGCGAVFPSRRSRDRHSANAVLHRHLLTTSDTEEEDSSPEKNLNGFNAEDCKEECNENRDPDHNGNKSDVSDQEDNDEVSSLRSGREPDEVLMGEDGMAVNCHVCHTKFKDNLALKEHFEVNHPKEIYHCTIKGCEKIFSTRKSRNRHSQNDNLHRPVAASKRNIVC